MRFPAGCLPDAGPGLRAVLERLSFDDQEIYVGVSASDAGRSDKSENASSVPISRRPPKQIAFAMDCQSQACLGRRLPVG